MTKPQLLLLPGLLNDAELWRDQISGLSDIADCVVPDLTQLDTLSALARSVLAQAAPAFALLALIGLSSNAIACMQMHATALS